MTSSATLLERLGGTTAVSTAVDDLYVRLLADPVVAPVFEGVDTAAVSAHMKEFLAAAVGAPGARYRGRDLHAAHAGLGITDEMFDRVATHLTSVLSYAGAEPAAVDEVVAKVAPLRAEVVQPS